MTPAEKSLLLYFETCEVDQAGAVDSRRMNDGDFEIAKRWDQECFVMFGRVKAKDVTETRSHFVVLSPTAWVAAHTERVQRASRMNKKRKWGRNIRPSQADR